MRAGIKISFFWLLICFNEKDMADGVQVVKLPLLYLDVGDILLSSAQILHAGAGRPQFPFKTPRG